MSDEKVINVRKLIKGNIKHARERAKELRRPRDPNTGKPPEMGSGITDKRLDLAGYIRRNRRDLARQTENFIDRTVGILFDRLLEYRGRKSGYGPGEAPARGSKGALKTAVGDALSKSRYGVDKPAIVKDGMVQDPGSRGGIDAGKRGLAGKFAQRQGKKPGMPKLQTRGSK